MCIPLKSAAKECSRVFSCGLVRLLLKILVEWPKSFRSSFLGPPRPLKIADIETVFLGLGAMMIVDACSLVDEYTVGERTALTYTRFA